MSKVTSKLQVTIPKALAVRYGIRPGDRVRWEELSRGAVMVRETHSEATGGRGPGGAGTVGEGTATLGRVPALLKTPAGRLAHFDECTRLIREAQEGKRWKKSKDRGWTREELYGDRGLPRPR